MEIACPQKLFVNNVSKKSLNNQEKKEKDFQLLFLLTVKRDDHD